MYRHEWIAVFVGVFILVFLSAAIVWWAVRAERIEDAASCKNLSTVTGLETKLVEKNCWIRVDGQWKLLGDITIPQPANP